MNSKMSRWTCRRCSKVDLAWGETKRNMGHDGLCAKCSTELAMQQVRGLPFAQWLIEHLTQQLADQRKSHEEEIRYMEREARY